MDRTSLRQAAIDLLLEFPDKASPQYQHSERELIYELRLQQVELEMQNEELRRAQSELEASRDKFANLFDFAPVGYVTVDPSNRIIEANLTFARLLSMERGAVVAQPFISFVVSEDLARLHRYLTEINSTERKTSCELMLKKADGNHLEVRLESIAADNGNHYIAIADLSENADLIRAREVSDERLKAICHALPIPIAVVDCLETYRFINAAHEQWFNHSRESIDVRHVSEVFGDEIYSLLQSHIKQVLSGRSCTFQLEFPSGDSVARLIEVHLTPFHDDHDEVAGYYEMMFDMSAASMAAAGQIRRAELETQLTTLSIRQRSICNALLNGKSNKAISYEIDLGVRTVERERRSILRLLEVESIGELLVKFAGLAEFDDTSGQAQ